MEGSRAQEESLCHSSFLYNVLSNFYSMFYSKNRAYTNRSLYFDRAIYSPEVMFFNYDVTIPFNTVYVDVITCAAPNKTSALNVNINRGVTEEDNYRALYNRCKFVLDVAEDNKVNTLILGAFGCGVFGQDPMDVADIFTKLLIYEGYSFDRVIFAVPNTGSSKANYNAFNYKLMEFEAIN